nr:oligosaccharide flippase family protein [Thermotogota bacterium]
MNNIDSPKSMLSNLFGFSIGPAFSALIGFISVPISSWLVRPEEFGISSMYSLFVSLGYVLVSFGMDHAFIREYNGTKEKHDLFTNVILFPLLFSFVLAALILSNYEKVTEAVFSYSSFLLGFLLSLGIALTVINNFFSFLLRMQENAKAYSTKIVINRTVYLICLLLFLLFYKKSGESIIHSFYKKA